LDAPIPSTEKPYEEATSGRNQQILTEGKSLLPGIKNSKNTIKAARKVAAAEDKIAAGVQINSHSDEESARGDNQDN